MSLHALVRRCQDDAEVMRAWVAENDLQIAGRGAEEPDDTMHYGWDFDVWKQQEGIKTVANRVKSADPWNRVPPVRRLEPFAIRTNTFIAIQRIVSLSCGAFN
jgi:hypothetical protein